MNINSSYTNFPASYLFSEIAKRVLALSLPHPLFSATLLNGSAMFAMKGISGSGRPQTPHY